MSKEIYAEKWQALRDRVGGKEGDELVAALKDLYSIYDERMVEWYAGLYDPKIGGYYYSNSARDNETVERNGKVTKLLPDAESTFQAIGWWRGAGLVGGVTEWGKWLPEWMQKQVGDFIYNLQDEDGFFYHPQWGKDISISRRARDLMWSRHIVEHLRGKLKYPTVTEAAKKDSEAEKSKTLIPDHLSNKEKFMAYLESLKITERSYHSGNELAAQEGQIKALGLADICCDYLSACQNELGHWNKVSNYYAVNGLFKITFVYNMAKRPIPRPLEAARSAIDAIVSDEPMTAVTDLYNTWYSISNIIENLRKYGGEDAENIVNTVLRELWAIAPKGIRCSKEKISAFRKADGGFSYGPKSSSPTSQSAPVAIPDSPEGDVNATGISSGGLVGNIYAALGLSDYYIPYLDPSLRDKYLKILEKKNAEK